MDTILKDTLFHIFSYMRDKDIVRLIFVSKMFLTIMPSYMGLKDTYETICLKSNHITIRKLRISGNISFAAYADTINNYRIPLDIFYERLNLYMTGLPKQCDTRHKLTIYINNCSYADLCNMFAGLITGSNKTITRADVISVAHNIQLNMLDTDLLGSYGVSICEFLKEYTFNILQDEHYLTKRFTFFTILKKEKRFIIGGSTSSKKNLICIQNPYHNYVHMDNVYYETTCCDGALGVVRSLHLESSVISITTNFHTDHCNCSNEFKVIDLTSYTNLESFSYNDIDYDRTVLINENIKYIVAISSLRPIIDKYPIGVIKIETNQIHGIMDLLKRRNVPIYFSLCLRCCDDIIETHELIYERSSICIRVIRCDKATLDMCEELLQYNGVLITEPTVVVDTYGDSEQVDTFLEICKLLIFIAHKCDPTKYPNMINLLKNNEYYNKVKATIAQITS